MYLYFELKKVVTKTSDKEGTIRAILSERGNKAIISTGVKIAIKDWAKGNPKQLIRNANIKLTLDKYKTAFNKYITATHLANELPSLVACKEFIELEVKSSISERGKKDLFSLIEQFKNEKKGFLKEGAIKPFTTLSNHLSDFNPNIQFADLNDKFRDTWVKFLSEKSKHTKGAKNLQNPTINKMIVHLKVFCRWALNNRHTSATDWQKIKHLKEIDQRIISLTMDELVAYYNFDFGDRVNLERAKDVFCFASFCGLRYNDLKQVNKHTVKKGYLHINTQKNDKELRIKLIPNAVAILEKYNYNLPLDISNQKLNKNIKTSVKLAGIDRQEMIIVQHLMVTKKVKKYVHQMISIHDARKTFITLGLEGGLSISEVMQMSTHSGYRSFSRYVNIEQSKVDEKLTDVFSQLRIVS